MSSKLSQLEQRNVIGGRKDYCGQIACNLLL